MAAGITAIGDARAGLKLAASAVVKRPARRKDRRPKRACRPTPTGKLPERRRRAAVAFVGKAKGVRTEAMRQAGYSRAMAEHHQSRVFEDPRVSALITRLLEEEGLTDKLVVRRHRQALDANITKHYQDQSLGEFADHQTRLQAVELFYRLRGLMTQRVEVEAAVSIWSEHVVRVIQKYVPRRHRQTCLSEIIRALSEAGRT
jgi:phage terminase small subunit